MVFTGKLRLVSDSCRRVALTVSFQAVLMQSFSLNPVAATTAARGALYIICRVVGLDAIGYRSFIVYFGCASLILGRESRLRVRTDNIARIIARNR